MALATKRRLSLNLSPTNLREKLGAINESIELGDSNGTSTESQGGLNRSKRWSLGTPYSSRKVKQLLSDDFTENSELDKLKQASLLKPLESATLEELLVELVTNSRKDSMFANYFLLTSEYLLSNSELVKKIIELYPRSVLEREDQYSIKMRTVNTLSKLMNLKPQIKDSIECMRMIRNFAGDLSEGNQVDKDVSAVLYKRMSLVTSPGKEDSPMTGRKRSNSMYNGLKSIKFDIIEDTARDIAEQFTLVSFESFKRIPMEVLLKKRFEKETDSHDTPLGRFVAFFNDSSRWICTQIVMATSEERPQRIAKFIMIMRELWSLSNFNGVMIFYSALNNGAISKLMDRIVPNLPEEVIQSFEEVKNLMDHRLNFKNYREDLEAAQAPCIPYIALMLRDLMHLEELETIEEDKRINWHKLSSIGKILFKFTYYQTASYDFVAIPHIQRYLVNFQRSTILNESELYELGRVVSNVSSSSIDMSRSSTSIDSDPTPEEDDIESSEEETEAVDVMQNEGLYPLPPWVLKREVTTSLGNLIEFNSVVAKKTVLFVFLRHFGCIICRKTASELMMIKPHLDRLGVKLVAVSTGTPAQAKAFKEEFNFEGEIYVDEARHLYDDFRCQRGWIKGVLNPKTQAMNAEARALGYSQGPIQGDILQLGGAFILKNGNVMYEHIEKYAGDLADPVDILKRLGACKDTIERVYAQHPQLRPKLKQISKKIRSLESKRKKIAKKLRRLSDKTPELLKADTSSSTLNRRRWSEKLVLNKRKSLEIDLNKDKEELIKKRHKYNQTKEKEMILELKIEKCRKKQLMLAEDSKEEKPVSDSRLRKAVY